jgi:hypothetical protein
MYEFFDTLPDGHRLFTKEDHAGVLIADDSGHVPDQTDDGELWLDTSSPLLIIQWKHDDEVKTSCAIPLKDNDQTPTRTTSDPITLLYLAARYDWPVRTAGAPARNGLYKVARTL